MGLFSVGISWYFGTKNKRIKKKIAEHEKSLSKIELYSSNTGYKALLYDCFHIFSYVGGLVLLSLGVKVTIFAMFSHHEILKFTEQFIAGIYIGAGLVLLKLFILLSRASKPEVSIKNIEAKIEKLKTET